MKRQSYITLCAGGTAGHTFPAITLAKEFKDNGFKTLIITDCRGNKHITDCADKIVILPIKRLGLGFFLKSPYLFLKSFYWISKSQNVICFGGYTTLFPFISAWLLRKTRCIYQLDSYVTRLNRKLIPFANYVFYSFFNTNLEKKKNTYCVGLPVRKEFKFSFPVKKDTMNISIIGGSLGSNYWKPLLKETLEQLPLAVCKKIHLKIQTTLDTEFLNKYELASIETSRFFDTAPLFKNSHLIIARAGATSIAEISSVGRPAYLVPWENAVENHQAHNAKNYSKAGGARFGNEASKLAEYILQLFQSNDFFYQECENATKAMPGFAASRAFNFITQHIKNQNN